MIDMKTETFMHNLERLFKAKPFQSLIHDESFKDMLFQRYGITLGRNSGVGLMYSDGPDDKLKPEEVLEKFSRLEQKRSIHLQRLTTTEIKSRKSNTDIPRSKSYTEYWSGNDSINTQDSDVLNVSHGGGFRFLKLILSGHHEGYRLEHQDARGIQVHPYSHDYSRLRYYGNYSRVGFDTPAVITFDIEAKYLDGQPNAYEAGVRSEFLEHASNFVLENRITGETIRAATLPDLRSELKKRSSRIGNL